MNKDKRNNIKLLGTLNNADESGIIANANQIYDANENKSTQDVSKEHTERIKTLETKENSMQTTLENITKTGEASAASNVTYNHSDSKLDATNVQQAIDEVSSISHFAKKGGVVNISTNYNSEHTAEVLTLAQALSKVPSTDRVLGFQGKYLASDGWHTIIYIGDSLTNWSDTTKWIDLSDRILKSISTNATFAGIATPTTNPGTPDGSVFYIATEDGTYSNFDGISVADGEAVILQWNDGAWIKKTTRLATEQEIIYDVSARNGEVVFESLQALLSSSNLSTLIPTVVRHGGMSIRFIQGSVPNTDNKYVQARLMANSFTTDTDYWAICEDGVYVDNSEFLYIKTDKNRKILWGIKVDGDIYYGAGCPTQLKNCINDMIARESEIFYELLNLKVDKMDGKSLIDSEYASAQHVIENREYLKLTTDKNRKILNGIRSDGTTFIEGNLEVKGDIINKGNNLSKTKNENLTEIPLIWKDGDIDKNYNTVADTNVIHTEIEVQKGFMYLVCMPETMCGGFVGRTQKDDTVVKKNTTNGFSVKNCVSNSLGVFVKNENLNILETPINVDLGTFESGSFDGVGNNILNEYKIRSGWVSINGRFKITFSPDVYVVLNIESQEGRKNFQPISGEICSPCNSKIRLAIAYKDGSLADGNLLNTAQIAIEIIAQPNYNLSTSSITEADMQQLKIYRLELANTEYDCIILPSDNSCDSDKANIILDGLNDNNILQAVIGCYNSVSIMLLGGHYNLTNWHYNRCSDQYCSLSTFANYNLENEIKINSQCDFRSNERAWLDIDSSLLSKVDDNMENAILLIPRTGTVENSLTNNITSTRLSIQNLSIFGVVYNRNITLIDGVSAGAVMFDKLNLRGYTRTGLQTFPTMPNDESVAIRVGCGSNNGIENHIKNSVACHFGKGISICGEHFIIEDVLAHHCKIGFAFGDKPTRGNMEHPNILIGCSIEACYRTILLSKMGETNEGIFVQDYNANMIRSTLVIIGLSTETSWHIPEDELIPGGATTTITLPIKEVLKGAYRGRVEMDYGGVPFETGSGEHFIFTCYSSKTYIGHFNTIDNQY